MESKRRKYNNGRRYSNATKERARYLRSVPTSYKGIARELGVSNSTARLWTREIILTDSQKERLIIINENRRVAHRWSAKEKRALGKRLAPYQYRKKYTKESLVGEIKRFFVEHGRIPFKREFNSRRAFRLYFGTWNAAILAAGFEPNPVLFAKRVEAIDRHVCDSVAEKIIDDWLYQNNINHERNVSYEGTKMTTDFKVGNVFIEYFGLEGANRRYDTLIERKRIFCKKRDIALLEIYPKQLFSKDFSQWFERTIKTISKNSHKIKTPS